MEGVLSRAVRLGAEQVNRRMQSIDPTMTVITGQARARGFVLEGYGVFFDVEVPTMSASAVWSMMTVQRDMQVAASLESLRRALASLPEGPEAAGGAAGAAAGRAPGRSGSGSNPVTDADGDRRAGGQHGRGGQVRPPPIDDPDRQYTEAVKSALIDAMLDHSLSMDLGAGRMADRGRARRARGRSRRTSSTTSRPSSLRVKGSDLAIYIGRSHQARRGPAEGRGPGLLIYNSAMMAPAEPPAPVVALVVWRSPASSGLRRRPIDVKQAVQITDARRRLVRRRHQGRQEQAHAERDLPRHARRPTTRSVRWR